MEEFLTPMTITPYRLAKCIGVQQTRIEQILDGKRSVTSDTAIRLGIYFGTTPGFWLNLQQMYDLEKKLRSLKSADAYKLIEPYNQKTA